jgi:transcriptional regulator with XRE-family HTH domain
MHIDSSNREGTIRVMESIGARIRNARKALGLTQVELANAVGLNQSTISDIENNAAFEATTLMAISQALLKSPQFIMTGKPEVNELSDVEAKIIAAFRQASPPPAPQMPAPSTAPTPARTGPRLRKVSSPNSIKQQRKVG